MFFIQKKITNESHHAHNMNDQSSFLEPFLWSDEEDAMLKLHFLSD